MHCGLDPPSKMVQKLQEVTMWQHEEKKVRVADAEIFLNGPNTDNGNVHRTL